MITVTEWVKFIGEMVCRQAHIEYSDGRDREFYFRLYGLIVLFFISPLIMYAIIWGMSRAEIVDRLLTWFYPKGIPPLDLSQVPMIVLLTIQTLILGAAFVFVGTAVIGTTVRIWLFSKGKDRLRRFLVVILVFVAWFGIDPRLDNFFEYLVFITLGVALGRTFGKNGLSSRQISTKRGLKGAKRGELGVRLHNFTKYKTKIGKCEVVKEVVKPDPKSSSIKE